MMVVVVEVVVVNVSFLSWGGGYVWVGVGGIMLTSRSEIAFGDGIGIGETPEGEARLEETT